MPKLKAEPPEAIRSLDELFAIAHGMEQEAATRYAELAERMRSLGNSEVAAIFAQLAEMEKGHVASVDQWSRQWTGTVPHLARRRWRPPETFDEEAAAEIGSSRLATAYRALSMAVRNEESAFAFWSYVAAQAEDPAVVQAAERMAQEELSHAWVLRRERRRAYHAGRRTTSVMDSQAPQADALVDPHRMERELAAGLRDLADERAAMGRTEDASLLRRLAEESDRMGEELAAGDMPMPAAGPHPPGRPPALAAQDRWQAVLRLAEFALEQYMGIAESTKDEAGVRKAQTLAERAIARYAQLERISGQASRG